MAFRESNLLSRLAELDDKVLPLRQSAAAAVQAAIDRFRLESGATQFHLRFPAHRPMLLAIVGGTGTGKSTLVNRLLGADVTATSFRRTFTAGAVAVAQSAAVMPEHWLGIDAITPPADALPVRGQADLLAVVPLDAELTAHTTLIDTPDLDGDNIAHHAQADRVFRWSQAICFVVTPEKYQMTELVPYYRMARRYGLPVLFVMNKVEEQAVVDDYAQLTQRLSSDETKSLNEPSPAAPSTGRLFALPRDGSFFEPPAEMNLQSLRAAMAGLKPLPDATRQRGLAARSADLLNRLRDQILDPLRAQRTQVDQLIAQLRAMETPVTGVDVNPLTRQLQRRLQQRSVLYLMGPGRMLDRVRQMPMLLARLPRTTWDLLRHGQIKRADDTALPGTADKSAPNFAEALADQLAIIHSRIDDALRSISGVATLLNERPASFAASKLPAAAAGKIADEEIADLRHWLETRWNATPRDTALLKKLLSLVPGGETLTRWSEAAPYLLAIIVATHHAFFGPVDLMVVGGFSLATWLTERLSNEVAWRTRLANQRIADRFTQLAHTQIESTIQWLNTQAPTTRALDEVEAKMETISAAFHTER